MAVAHDRSMNREMDEGATDGTLRKRHSGDRGGVIESTADVAHDQAVAMGTSPQNSYPNYGESEERAILSGVRRR